MSTRKDREQAIADLTQEGWPLADIRLVLRYATTLTRLAEEECNRILTSREALTIQRLERRIATLAGCHDAKATFSGDPRGYVVKLILPSGRYNTWGGKESGYGI